MEKQLRLSLLCSVMFWSVTSTLGSWEPRYVEPEILDELLSTKQYSLFSELVGIQDVNLVIPREGEHTSEELLHNENLKHGDILPYPWESKESSANERRKVRQAINFAMYPTFKWDKTVPFVIMNGYTQQEKKMILDHIEIFNSVIQNVQFIPRTNELNYAYIMSGNGCYSFLGKVGGAQPISLQQNGCLTTRTILHEMTHCVGMGHEHVRFDRDNYVNVLYDNIPIEYYSQYEKQDDINFQLINTYDYYSIMHYTYRFPGETKPAFKILMNGIDTERIGGDNFTRKDVKKIKKLYQ